MSYPKITIITPSYNQGQYIEETILSIINQGYPNLEFIIIDGGSTDNTIDIIKKYEQHIAYWVSEADEGMYHAIQKGFDKSTGEIMAWLNSDDVYAQNSFSIIAEIFSNYSDIEWITGNAAQIDEKSRIINTSWPKFWTKWHYKLGDYKYIQQESTFWRRSLWEKAGGVISTKYTLASDLELWARFFNYGKLYSVDAIIGMFRLRSINQKSLEHLNEYDKEAIDIIASYLDYENNKKEIDLIKNAQKRIIWRLYTKKIKYLVNEKNYIKFNRFSQKFEIYKF